MKRVYFKSRSVWSSIGLFVLVVYGGAKYYVRWSWARTIPFYKKQDYKSMIIDSSYFKDPNLSDKPIEVKENILLKTEDIRRPVKVLKSKDLAISASMPYRSMIIFNKVISDVDLSDFLLAFFKYKFNASRLYFIKDLLVKNNLISGLPDKVELESIAIERRNNSGFVILKVANQEKYFYISLNPKNLKIIQVKDIDYDTKDSLQKKLLKHYLGFRIIKLN